MPIAPTPYAIVHIARFETDELDEHNNFVIESDDPVVRYIYSYSQFGRRGSSRIVEGPEFQDRVDTVLHLATPEPTVFSAGDQVIMNPELDDDGNYIEETGTAYWVDGDAANEETSPWPRYTNPIGGLVKIRRVS